jgi:F-type H+-transporting ATPase subunit alpha
VVYAGVKGLIDEVPVDQVTVFARELREYLKSSKPEFVSAVMGEKQLSEASEAILKDAIKTVVSSIAVAA